jgi:hypothetical protein
VPRNLVTRGIQDRDLTVNDRDERVVTIPHPVEDITGVRRALLTNLRERGELRLRQGRAVRGLTHGRQIRLWPASAAPTCCI